jgi:hypothetical protein
MKKHTAPTRYCEYCGAKMDVENMRDDGFFDRETGEEVHLWRHWYKCPNKRNFLDKHSRYNDIPIPPY